MTKPIIEYDHAGMVTFAGYETLERDMVVIDELDWKRRGDRPLITVVSGLAIDRANRTMLMQKRKPGKRRGDMWEHPGGKVEAGEDLDVALAREWREELGVAVVVGKQLAMAVLYVEVVLVLRLFEVQVDDPRRLTPHEASERRWVTPEDAVLHLPCTPATYAYHDAIVHHFRVNV
jgi:8-oxo-dGTP diphosphatase